MRVAIVAGKIAGGAWNARTARVGSLAAALGRLGHEVTVFVAAGAGGFEAEPAFDPAVAVVPVQATALKRNPIRIYPEHNLPGVLAELSGGGFELAVFASSRLAPSALLAGALGLRVIVDFPVIEEDLVREVAGKVRALVDSKVAERAAAREPEGLLASCEADRGILIRRHAAHAARVVVFPAMAADHAPAEADPARADAIAWFGDPAEDLQDGASFDALRGSVIPWIKRLRPGTRFVVSGPATERAAGRVGVEAAPAGGIGGLLERARCLVLPLSSGVGCQEQAVAALARGVPVVGTRAALRGLEDLGGAGCVSAASDDELARALVRLLDDAELARRLGVEGRAAVLGKRGGAAIEGLGGLIERVRRAWIDPAAKFAALHAMPGTWPETVDEVWRFLGVKVPAG